MSCYEGLFLCVFLCIANFVVMLLDWLQQQQQQQQQGLMPKHAQHRAPEELEALEPLGGPSNRTLREVNQIIILICAMIKSRYIGDGHPTFNRNPYNGYINTYYWVDDHPLLYGNNGSLDPGTYCAVMCVVYIHTFIFNLSMLLHFISSQVIFSYILLFVHIFFLHLYVQTFPGRLAMASFELRRCMCKST